MTAGVAVIGASILAVAPVIATPPDVKIVNPAVQESANPLETYVETVREALENLEALLGSAFALPAPTGWTLELALDSMLNDPGCNVQLFVDEIEALGPLAGASLPVLLENAAGAVQSAIERAAQGNFDAAIVSLIRTYVTLAPAVVAVVGAPLKLLGPELAQVATVVLAKTLNAAAGPVLSGIGKAGVAIQNVANALNEAEPGSGAVLAALIAAPGTVADGVLHGFASAPSAVSLPGLLTPGDAFDPTKPDPGPVALAVSLAQGFGAALTPKQPAATVAAPANDRVVTLDVNAGQGAALVGATPPAADVDELQDPDDGTNKNVMADQGGTQPSVGEKHQPRLFGGNPARGAEPATLRQGIRDGIREFRDDVRTVVNTVTGQTADKEGANAPAGGESPGQ
jgi:hypothetical protein